MPVTQSDPTTIATRWQAGLAGATQKITDGVNAVTVAPGQAAARQQNAYLAGVQNNVQKWARNVAAVSLSDWQSAMTNKGIARIASGATTAEPKFAAFMGKLLSAEKTLYGQLPARGTTDQNIQRAVAWMQGMAKMRGTFTG